MTKNQLLSVSLLTLLLISQVHTQHQPSSKKQYRSKRQLNRNLRNNVAWCKTFSKEFLNIAINESDIAKGKKFHIWITEEGSLEITKPDSEKSSFEISPFKDLTSTTKISFDLNTESKVFWHKNDLTKFTIISLHNSNRPLEVNGDLKKLLNTVTNSDLLLNMDALFIGMTCQLKSGMSIQTVDVQKSNQKRIDDKKRYQALSRKRLQLISRSQSKLISSQRIAMQSYRRLINAYRMRMRQIRARRKMRRRRRRQRRQRRMACNNRILKQVESSTVSEFTSPSKSSPIKFVLPISRQGGKKKRVIKPHEKRRMEESARKQIEVISHGIQTKSNRVLLKVKSYEQQDFKNIVNGQSSQESYLKLQLSVTGMYPVLKNDNSLIMIDYGFTTYV